MDRHLLFLLALFGLLLVLMYGGPVFVSVVVQILLMWAGVHQVMGEWIVTRLRRIPDRRAGISTAFGKSGISTAFEHSAASTGFRVFDADHDPTRERLERVQ